MRSPEEFVALRLIAAFIATSTLCGCAPAPEAPAHPGTCPPELCRESGAPGRVAGPPAKDPCNFGVFSAEAGDVTIVELAAHPDHHAGRRVRVRGMLSLDFEMTGLVDRSRDILVDVGLTKELRTLEVFLACNNREVIVEGESVAHRDRRGKRVAGVHIHRIVIHDGSLDATPDAGLPVMGGTPGSSR